MGLRRSLTALVAAALVAAFASAGACCAHGARHGSDHLIQAAAEHRHAGDQTDGHDRSAAGAPQFCAAMCGMILAAAFETAWPARPTSGRFSRDPVARAEGAAPATPPPRPA